MRALSVEDKNGWTRRFGMKGSNVVGAMGSDEHEDVVLRDLDLGMIRDVRNAWQFYRDRRPDSYAAITQP